MPDDRNAKIIEEFRANHGRVGGYFQGAPLLLLHTVGAKTGEERVSPMMYLEGEDRRYVFASYAGRPMNPAWFHNLMANPKVRVEVGDEAYEALAAPLSGAERDEIYAEQARRYPGFAEYQAKTTRVIPVVALTRV